MRVAYICADPGVPAFGRKGCSIHVTEVLRALVRRGASVDLFGCRFDAPPPRDLRSVRILRLGKPSQDSLAQREQDLLACNTKLQHMLDHRQPFDLVYERFSLWSFAAMEYARCRRVPGLLEVNAPLIDEQRTYRELFHYQEAEDAQRRAMRAASAIVAVSGELAAWLRSSTIVRSRSTVEVVPNGVNPLKFANAAANRCDKQPGTFTIGFVGSLRPWHDLTTLLEAFLKLSRDDRGWRLLIVGEGPERSRAESRLMDVAADVRSRVTFTGAVEHDMVPSLLASMDVAVVPYAGQQTCYYSPLKLFEYMAAGLPIVASRVGQVSEVIVDGVSGLLYPPGKVGALAATLDKVRSHPELRRLLGAAARRAVYERHTWDGVVKRILEIAGLPDAVAADEMTT